MGYTAYGDRRDAAGSALSAFAGGGQGAELGRQGDGRFLDTRGAGPVVSQGPILESGGATTGWNDRTAGTAGIGPLCRDRVTVGEGLCRVYAVALIADRGNDSR